MNQPSTIEEVCAALAQGGHPDLARRIAYFASAEDLEDGDAPVAPESVLGFWEFFRAVESAGELDRLDLACSPEGCLSGNWEFGDKRGASIWFQDFKGVMFAAQGADGKFIRVNSGNVCDRVELLEKLVEAGLFVWRQEKPGGKNLNPRTMSPGTAEVAI